jgi:hypothetical protein
MSHAKWSWACGDLQVRWEIGGHQVSSERPKSRVRGSGVAGWMFQKGWPPEQAQKTPRQHLSVMLLSLWDEVRQDMGQWRGQVGCWAGFSRVVQFLGSCLLCDVGRALGCPRTGASPIPDRREGDGGGEGHAVCTVYTHGRRTLLSTLMEGSCTLLSACVGSAVF